MTRSNLGLEPVDEAVSGPEPVVGQQPVMDVGPPADGAEVTPEPDPIDDDPVVEPTADVDDEPVVDPATADEPAVERGPVADAPVPVPDEPPAEAVADGAEPVVDAEPVAEAAEPVTADDQPADVLAQAEAATEPDAATVTEPAAEPEPATATASELTAEGEPVAASASEPAVVAEGEPVATAVTEPDAEGEAVVVAEGEPAAAEGEPGAEGEAAAKPSPAVKIVEGIVTSVSAEEVELTLDDGRPAVISRRNFGSENEDPTTVLSVGDRAFGAKLTREDPKKRVVLSRAWALKLKAWDSILEAIKLNATVSARVVSVGAKGVVVDASGVRGFVPSSHLALDSVADLSPYLDQTLELKVLEADPMRERLVLSRRALLLKEQRRKAQDILTSLKPGDRATGKVTSITDYGAFVDIGGVNGLVHLSELSWQRVRKAADVVTLGAEVEVVVLDVKAKKRRISLSIRRTRPDPLSVLVVGEVRVGQVTRLVDFGAFVRLDDVEGLVHLSELAEYRVSTPDEVVAPGDQVGVKILSVDSRRRRVELSIRQAAEYGG